MDISKYLKIKNNLKEKAKGMVALALLTGVLVGGTSCETKVIEPKDNSSTQTTDTINILDYCDNNASEKHDFSIVNKEASCTETGEVECSKCGEVRKTPKSHKYGKWELKEDFSLSEEETCHANNYYNKDLEAQTGNGDYMGKFYTRTCEECGEQQSIIGLNEHSPEVGSAQSIVVDCIRYKYVTTQRAICERCREYIYKSEEEEYWHTN